MLNKYIRNVPMSKKEFFDECYVDFPNDIVWVKGEKWSIQTARNYLDYLEGENGNQ